MCFGKWLSQACASALVCLVYKSLKVNSLFNSCKSRFTDAWFKTGNYPCGIFPTGKDSAWERKHMFRSASRRTWTETLQVIGETNTSTSYRFARFKYASCIKSKWFSYKWCCNNYPQICPINHNFLTQRESNRKGQSLTICISVL